MQKIFVVEHSAWCQLKGNYQIYLTMAKNKFAEIFKQPKMVVNINRFG